ncbi:MAG TPA: phenylalanine--tRNA ligase subunit beta, partial [Mycobacteriales bacterium]|nr:phenylalanine--tRNA ligase subunit beta [Mycobacteriales bacterium]
MRVPLSWLREYVEVPETLPAREVAGALIRLGLEVETVEQVGAGVQGPLVVGEVVDVEDLSGYKKPIRWCHVDVGPSNTAEGPRGVICGAANFAVGDRVVLALPGAVLPGGFAISARRTYDHLSDGMICSARELGLGEDHTGILVLPPDTKVGADAAELLELRDDVLDIDLLPDRGYCMSMRGMAREASHALDVAFRDAAAVKAAGPDGRGWPVRVEDPTGCDRFSARTVRGLDPTAQSPLWMRRRLLMCGMRPISLAVDVTNYVMLETGQPMHAFDLAALRGALVVRRPRAGEELVTLDGTRRTLHADDLLVTDESGPLALAGVMGGASSEIAPDTADIVLEAAHWDPTTIGRMVRRHRLPSEAARRFERGVDPQVALAALHRAAGLLAEYGGASVDGEITVVGGRFEPRVIRLPDDLPGRVAGRPIPQGTVVRRLMQIGCSVAGDTVLTVQPPSWRPDLTDPADLVEEVVRLEGYDTVPSVLPRAPQGNGLTPQQRVRRDVGRALASAGYVEVLTYPFVSPGVYDAFGLDVDDPRRRALRLVNPISEQEPDLRTSLLPGLVRALARNIGRGNRDVALFETGLVYLPRGRAGAAPTVGVDHRPTEEQVRALDATLPNQPRHVGVVLAGDRDRPGWWGEGRPAGWADAVQAARIVARAARADLEVRSASFAPWHPGRCAELLAHGRVIGMAGELHPRAVAALDLPARTAAMELDLGALGIGEPTQLGRLSTFPPALLDVALVVDVDVPAAEVESALRAGAGDLLEELRLFDVYSGDQVGAGR